MRELNKESTTQAMERQPQRAEAPAQQPRDAQQEGASQDELVGLNLDNLLSAALSGPGADQDGALGEMERRLGWQSAFEALSARGEQGFQLANARWGGWLPATPPVQKKRDNRGSQRGGERPSGSGSALPGDVLNQMEGAFGTDFSGVRVSKNDGVVQASGARAMTAGDKMAFAPGEFNPGSGDGQKLIAHELTHVVQQRQGKASGSGVLDDSALEQQADNIADKVVSGGASDVTTALGTDSGMSLPSLGLDSGPTQFKRALQAEKLAANAQLVAVMAGNSYLRRGSTGPAVRLLQEVLTAEGFYTAKVDGQFGGLCEAAMRAYQSDRGLTSDGIVGRKTLIELDVDALEGPVAEGDDKEAPAAAEAPDAATAPSDGGTNVAPEVSDPLKSTDNRIVRIFSGTGQVDAAQTLLAAKNPSEMTGDEAFAFVSLLSEEDIKIVRFNSDGHARYVSRDGVLSPNRAASVPSTFFNAAGNALSNLGAAKGLDGAVPGAFKVDEQIKGKIEAQKVYQQAMKDIGEAELRHAQLMDVAAELDTPAKRAKVNQDLAQVEAQLSQHQKRADQALGEYSQSAQKKGVGEVVDAAKTILEPFAKVYDAHVGASEARTRRSQLRNEQDESAYRIRVLQEDRENAAGNRQQRRGTQAAIDRELKKEKKRLLAKQNAAKAAHQAYKTARNAKSSSLKSFVDTVKNKTDKSFSADIVSIGTQLYSNEVWKHEVCSMPVPMGGAMTGHTKVMMAEANANANLSVGPDGISASASANAKAALVDVSYQVDWVVPDLNLMGEVVGAKIFVFVRGFVGAEAKAALHANLKSKALKSVSDGVPKLDTDQIMKGTGMKVDSKGKGAVDASAGANAEAFAGAKLTIGAGAAVDWKKKNKQAYIGKLQDASKSLIDIVSMGNPGIRWLLDQMGADAAAESLLDTLFQWGAPGTIPIIGLQASVEGSAGIGAKLVANVGYQGGKISMNYAAGATFGLGLAGSVQLDLDVLNGMKFALVVMGQLRKPVVDWAEKELKDQIARGVQAWNSIIDWFSADDIARAGIASGAHKVVAPAERANMIRACLEGWTGEEDQNAVVEVLKFSKSKGDIAAVLRHVDKEWILSDLYGDQDAEARSLMGVK